MELHLADGGKLNLDRPRIMGVLNVTPDSFSDGGLYLDESAAVARGQRMLEKGADLLDVGGQSTRPGAAPVPAEIQCKRVLGVIRALRRQVDAAGRAAVISIDTPLVDVARAALDAGAQVINDVQAGRHPGMLELAAARRVPIVLMHMQGTPATMQHAPAYDDVVAEVLEFLMRQVALARSAGVLPEQIVIDPGIGFGKTLEHNLAIMAGLDRFVQTGHAVLLGASRKRFLGALCAGDGGTTPPADRLDAATGATTAWGVRQGVRLFRVHDVVGNRQTADVTWALMHAAARPAPAPSARSH